MSRGVRVQPSSVRLSGGGAVPTSPPCPRFSTPNVTLSATADRPTHSTVVTCDQGDLWPAPCNAMHWGKGPVVNHRYNRHPIDPGLQVRALSLRVRTSNRSITSCQLRTPGHVAASRRLRTPGHSNASRRLRTSIQSTASRRLRTPGHSTASRRLRTSIRRNPHLHGRTSPDI